MMTTLLTSSGSLVAGIGPPVAIAWRIARHRRRLATRVATPVSAKTTPSTLTPPGRPDMTASTATTTNTKAVERHD
jgi:hypothetical protein